MADPSLSVKITADVVDLQARLAIAQANLWTFKAELNSSARWRPGAASGVKGTAHPRQPKSALTARCGPCAVQTEPPQKIPPSHLEFLSQLKLHHVEGDYLFVHAGLRPGGPLEQQTAQDMMWIREEFLEISAEFGKLVVHGHSISAERNVRFNRIGIDTGAFASGRLTCLVLEGTTQSFLTT